MTRYIFCVIAVLVQPLFVWYVYHKHDKREAALKIPMIGCSVLYLVVQVYAFFKLCIKIPGKYGIFSYLVQAVILGRHVREIEGLCLHHGIPAAVGVGDQAATNI